MDSIKARIHSEGMESSVEFSVEEVIAQQRARMRREQGESFPEVALSMQQWLLQRGG